MGTPGLMELHGETVTYYPLSGGSSSRTAIVDRASDVQEDTGAGLHTPLSATVLMANDATIGVTAVVTGDTIAVGGVDYKVASRRLGPGGWIIQCVTTTNDETTAPGTRRHRA